MTVRDHNAHVDRIQVLLANGDTGASFEMLRDGIENRNLLADDHGDTFWLPVAHQIEKIWIEENERERAREMWTRLVDLLEEMELSLGPIYLNHVFLHLGLLTWESDADEAREYLELAVEWDKQRERSIALDRAGLTVIEKLERCLNGDSVEDQAVQVDLCCDRMLGELWLDLAGSENV